MLEPPTNPDEFATKDELWQSQIENKNAHDYFEKAIESLEGSVHSLRNQITLSETTIVKIQKSLKVDFNGLKETMGSLNCRLDSLSLDKFEVLKTEFELVIKGISEPKKQVEGLQIKVEKMVEVATPVVNQLSLFSKYIKKEMDDAIKVKRDNKKPWDKRLLIWLKGNIGTIATTATLIGFSLKCGLNHYNRTTDNLKKELVTVLHSTIDSMRVDNDTTQTRITYHIDTTTKRIHDEMMNHRKYEHKEK